MDVRKPASNRVQNLKNISLKISKWLENRFVIGRYSYSYKSISITLVALSALTIIFYFSAVQFMIIRQDPKVAAQREIRSITGRIGKFMELPQGEEPTLATVSDQEKLKGQQFFANAKNGDKVLVYPKAKKAILFRPSSGKIIEVANLTSGGGSVSPAAEPAANPQGY